ncbi:MAG: endo-1,4-beta-xylanase [Marinilabilia sp.]
MRKLVVIVLIAFTGLSFYPGEGGSDGLRQAADESGTDFGFAVHNSFFNMEDDDPYLRILKKNANTLVAENAMKPYRMQPEKGNFFFEETDRLVEFATENDIKVRGHCLVWHKQIPDWMNDTTYTREEMLEILENHITTIVSRYKGQVDEWDVVNEAIDTDEENNYRRTVWYRTIGPEFIDSAFVYAHRADPSAVLYYNDFSAEEMNEKSDAIYKMVKRLVQNDVPIHAVGLQSHFWLNEFNVSEIENNMDRIGALGLQANITELDISIPMNEISQETLQQQADDYADIMEMCLDNDHCNSLLIWGVPDSHSWIPNHTDGERGSALIFDDEMNPKPAFHALKEVLDNK